ncbi:MAG: NADH:flavin oxidoreductase [Chloroflexi bacterium]|nr:NADH:flavin oxidoreductase [Chloroflexota bacterium]
MKEGNCMPDAFSPISIKKSLALRNRFMRSATHDWSADESGAPTAKSLSTYEKLGEGEMGLITTGYAFVSAQGQAAPAQYGAHNDSLISGLSRMAQAAHKGGGKIALQIVHAGLASPYLAAKGVTCLTPSHMADSSFPHHEMTHSQIETTIEDFGSAAARARQAGFDAVQFHGAHGYLMSQFLSPLTNRRTDIWGGSPENRRRFHVEAVKEVRQRVGPDFPVLIKFGIMDDEPGGTTLAEGIATAVEMVAVGLDAIEVSAGIGVNSLQRTIRKPSTPDNEKPWFRDRAAALKRAVDVPVMLVGGIRSPEMAESILNAGEADVISMSRPFIREPQLIRRWLAGDHRPARCITCNLCYRMLRERQEVLDSYCWQESPHKRARRAV